MSQKNIIDCSQLKLNFINQLYVLKIPVENFLNPYEVYFTEKDDTSLDQIDTISGLTILGHVSGMTAEYEASLHVPVCVPIVMEAVKETCKESYLKVGRSDLYNENMVHYVTEDQFAYVWVFHHKMLKMFHLQNN